MGGEQSKDSELKYPKLDKQLEQQTQTEGAKSGSEVDELESKLAEASLSVYSTDNEVVGSDAVQEHDLSISKVMTKYQPWRVVKDTTLNANEFLQKLKDDIGRLKPITKVNILIVGYVGAGKSSYINTINSHAVGYVSERAAFGEDASSLTRKFRKYCFEHKDFKHICLFDTKGADYLNFGLESTDFESLLNGNIKDNYVFRTMPIRKGNMKYNPLPDLKDKPHTVCFVYDGTNVEAFGRNAIHRKRLKEFFDKISKMKDLRYIILLTKMDEVCDEVNKDPSCVYTSIVVRDLVMRMAKYLKIAENNIVPVVNYRPTEQSVNISVDILALIALRQMLRKAKDFLDK